MGIGNGRERREERRERRRGEDHDYDESQPENPDRDEWAQTPPDELGSDDLLANDVWHRIVDMRRRDGITIPIYRRRQPGE